MLARSFPEVAVRPAAIRTIGGTPVADYGWLKAAGGANAAVLMGSLPRLLRGALDTFPKPHAFLMPDPQEVARWKAIFGKYVTASNGEAIGHKKIGICWRSGKLGGHRSIEFAPLECWGALLRDTDATFVCTQYDAAPDEIAALEAISGRKIIVPEGIDQKNELDRACALMAALDLVISAPTAVACMAAGVGTRTLKVLYGLSWTALGCGYRPFAPACECLMPKAFGDWADVFAQVKAKLKAPS